MKYILNNNNNKKVGDVFIVYWIEISKPSNIIEDVATNVDGIVEVDNILILGGG